MVGKDWSFGWTTSRVLKTKGYSRGGCVLIFLEMIIVACRMQLEVVHNITIPSQDYDFYTNGTELMHLFFRLPQILFFFFSSIPVYFKSFSNSSYFDLKITTIKSFFFFNDFYFDSFFYQLRHLIFYLKIPGNYDRIQLALVINNVGHCKKTTAATIVFPEPLPMLPEIYIVVFFQVLATYKN